MKILFQSSLPRSGATLLQNVLAENPAFYVTPTSGVLDLVFGARLSYTSGPEFKAQDHRVMEKAFLSFCRKGMEGYFEAITDRSYVWDISRGWGVNFDLLKSNFGSEPKLVCMVRDLRAIVTSFEKRFRKNPAIYKPIEKHGTMEGITTFKRAIHRLQTRWGWRSNASLKCIREGSLRKCSSCDNFVCTPPSTMKQIYNYLGLPEFAHQFDCVAGNPRRQYSIRFGHTIA